MTTYLHAKIPALRWWLFAVAAIAFAAALLFVTPRSSDIAYGTDNMPCADLDGNGYVDRNDTVIIINNVGFVPPSPPQADMNGDTVVDLQNDVLFVTFQSGTFTACQDKPIAPAPEMSLGAQGYIDCNGDDIFDFKPNTVAKPTKCTAIYNPNTVPSVGKTIEFQITVDTNLIPKNGYNGFFTEVVGLCQGPNCATGSLVWNPDTCDDEIVWLDDAKPSCDKGGGGQPRHSSTSGNTTPYPLSTYTGPLVKLDAYCPGAGSFQVALVTWPHFTTGGTRYQDRDGFAIALLPTGTVNVDLDGDTTVDTVNVADVLKINCMTPPKLLYPGDTDGDGCPDANENQATSEVTNGGGRDYLNPWDYYDVNGDGVIDIINDILGVVDHWQPNVGGAPPYDVTFDRGPTAGPNPWNLTAPDGVIDLINDVLGVIDQFAPLGCTNPGP